MPNQQPIITSTRGRKFVASAAGLLAFLVNADEKILLLAHPKRKGEWEVINGALEGEETVLQGVLREVREEVGAEVQAHPLGVFHAYTFYFDDNVQYMLSLCYVLHYENGAINPGDDMAGSAFQWFSSAEIADPNLKLIVPRDQKWLAQRAVETHRLWQNQTVQLQPALDPTARTKYAL